MIELIGDWLTNQPWQVIGMAFVVGGSSCALAVLLFYGRLGGG
jgi:hypothetical protein